MAVESGVCGKTNAKPPGSATRFKLLCAFFLLTSAKTRKAATEITESHGEQQQDEQDRQDT
jgi:hypothetical protein